MILLFPQATDSFNLLFSEMIEKSSAQSFLDKSFNSYKMNKVTKVILVVLENKIVEHYLKSYLSNSDLIKDFEIILLKKETSGSICTSLMSISSLKNQAVIISALDQIIIGNQLDFDEITVNKNADIIAPTLNSDDSSLCFTLKDDSNKVIQLFEKKAVSNDAILGIYMIKNFSVFYKNCYELLIKYKGFKERAFYTSDVINNYIGQGYQCEFPSTENKYYKIRSLNDLEEML
tara:strand:- start:166 stop:864 length:699 start_codon:yes stop_codon:yes gene_type:complete